MNKEKVQLQLEYKNENGSKYIPISTYFKCQWTECSYQKTQSGRLDKKTRSYNMLLKRVSLQDKRHTQIETEGMEKDITCKHK